MSDVRHIDLPNGIRIEYEEAGAGPRPFVLVHGFTGSRDDWLEHIPALAKLGRTIAPDQRGHGGSTNTGDAAGYTLDQLTADLDATLDSLGIQSCDLLGHSMGGMVALRLALSRPERFSSLILMDTSARSVEFERPEMIQLAIQLVKSSGTSALAPLMREAARGEGGMAPSTKRAMEAMGPDVWWRRIEAKLENMDPVAFVSLMEALTNQESLLDRLGEIRCPTTVIVGEEDVPLVEAAEEMSSSIPGAVQVNIPDAAHSPQLENPAPWFEAVRGHLERVRESS
jgi:2-succinyl-6-hydroxy-2,4-cyclohexadiene-1-carboxylate synthase